MKEYRNMPNNPSTWMGPAIEKVIKTIDSIESVQHVKSTQRMVDNLHDFLMVWSFDTSEDIKKLLMSRIEIIKSFNKK